jgi:hypothetical protein
MAGSDRSTMLEDAPVSMARNGGCDRLGSEGQHANGAKGMHRRTWPIKPSRVKSSSENPSEKPLTKEDMVAYLVSGCKAKAKWRSDLNIQFSWNL